MVKKYSILAPARAARGGAGGGGVRIKGGGAEERDLRTAPEGAEAHAPRRPHGRT